MTFSSKLIESRLTIPVIASDNGVDNVFVVTCGACYFLNIFSKVTIRIAHSCFHNSVTSIGSFINETAEYITHFGPNFFGFVKVTYDKLPGFCPSGA